jgi:hypothetical protein
MIAESRRLVGDRAAIEHASAWSKAGTRRSPPAAMFGGRRRRSTLVSATTACGRCNRRDQNKMLVKIKTAAKTLRFFILFRCWLFRSGGIIVG